MVYLEQELTVKVFSTVPLDINCSLAGILDFGEDIVSEADIYSTEPSIKSAISSSFNRKEL